MRELLTVQDGGEAFGAGGQGDGSEVVDGEDSPLKEEEVEGIRQRTAKFLLGEGRCVTSNVMAFRRYSMYSFL